MTQIGSYTSGTPSNRNAVPLKVSISAKNWHRALWLAIFLLAAAIRLMRLSWQPLWWDEGYSIYFATEPISRMLWLTAQDIHPPLYYLLLHLWFGIFGNSGPETARLLSVVIGLATLPVMTEASLTLWPGRRWLALIATFFLAISPFDLYYSQEVRMYGLALLLTLAASTLLWCIQQHLEQNQKAYGLTVAYVITASLALYSLYYTGFLLLAHQLWALVVNRRQRRRQLWFVVAALIILLLQLPWWIYALPKLSAYVGQKVQADQDLALPVWSYFWRHWLAFFAGHLVAIQPLLEAGRQLVVAAIAVVLAIALSAMKPKDDSRKSGRLLSLLLIPFACAFLVNLRYPFFPDGAERSLLQLLPYLLLFVTFVIFELAASRRWLATLLLTLPLLAAMIGLYIFFSTPRYTEHDYRPIIAEVTTNSRPNDAVLALFPWQVGYWRAYSPKTISGALLPPQPAPVDQVVLRWDDAFASRLDAALHAGTIWFPEPLSFGSSLPIQIEDYLKAHARNLENRWYSSATRLSAWTQIDKAPTLHPIATSFLAHVALTSAGVAPTTVASANTPVAIDLCWQPPIERQDLRVTLRLLDGNGYIWAQRDQTPLAAYASLVPDNPCLEAISMAIPVGIPPDAYQLVLGVGTQPGEQLMTPVSATSPFVPLATITVTAPSEAISPDRLPMQHRLSTPVDNSGLLLIGYNGPHKNDELLAGDAVAMALFLQNLVTQPPARDLYVELQDGQNDPVAGWQGWPLPKYPTNSWMQGALTQAPLTLDLPATLSAGKYSLVAGFVDPATKKKSQPALLTTVSIKRRLATFEMPLMQETFTPTMTFGSHANLLGYSVFRTGNTLQLTLTWQILQSLLPPHHIFVHLLDANGQLISQNDGEPMTTSGRAPTGSWLAGEFLTTQHTVMIPGNVLPPLTIETGLYLPSTSTRLPVSVNGVTVGDGAFISVTQISAP